MLAHLHKPLLVRFFYINLLYYGILLSYDLFHCQGSNLFGQQQPSTSGLFGSNATTAFGQNKPTFGFGSTQPQTGLFGQQAQTQAATPSFQSNTSNLFGGSSFVSQQPTTTGTTIKFAPVTGSDTMQKNGISTAINTKHHCITCMKEYANKSFEELR